jgi:hypothetical protein
MAQIPQFGKSLCEADVPKTLLTVFHHGDAGQESARETDRTEQENGCGRQEGAAARAYQFGFRFGVRAGGGQPFGFHGNGLAFQTQAFFRK